MDNECGFYKYCADRGCAECKEEINRGMLRNSGKPERDAKKAIEAEQRAIRKADIERRKLEQKEKSDRYNLAKAEKELLLKESKKKCSECCEILDIEEFYMGRSVGKRYRQNKCKKCTSDAYLKKHGKTIPYGDGKAKVAAIVAKGMQFCKKCGIEKPFDAFDKSNMTKGIPTEFSTGYRLICRDCKNEAIRIRESTPEKIAAREKRAARGAEIAKEKEEIRLRVEKRDAERAHPDYQSDMKARQHKKTMDYRKRRMLTDPAYRIKITLRSRIRKMLKGKIKVGSHIRDLGCSIAELKIYLEAKFKRGMTWDNHGKVWHIDHIIALSTFDLTVREEYLKAVHYTNLQPLTIKANLEKGNRHITGQQFCLI